MHFYPPPGWQSLNPQIPVWIFPCPKRFRTVNHFSHDTHFIFHWTPYPPWVAKSKSKKSRLDFFHAKIDSRMFTTFSHGTHSIFHWTPYQPWVAKFRSKNSVRDFFMPKSIPKCSPLFPMTHIPFFIGLHINPGILHTTLAITFLCQRASSANPHPPPNTILGKFGERSVFIWM